MTDPAVVRDLRDRLLSALLAEGPAELVRNDEQVALVCLPDSVRVALVSSPAEGGLDPALRDLVRQPPRQVGDRPTPALHLVAVGAGEEEDAALKSLAPFWQLSYRFGFHRVDPEGRVTRVTGSRLRILGRAAERLRDTAPLPATAIDALLAEGAARNAGAGAGNPVRGAFPWVTAAIAAMCVVLFGLAKIWAGGSFSLSLFRMGANSGMHVAAGEVWRLLSSAFLHGSIEHLVVNLLALASFGIVLERLLGPRRYILLYAASALGGGLASALLRDGGMSVGASGAIWGLMGAGIGLAIRPRGLLPAQALAGARRRAMIPLAINTAYSFMPGIDLYAHFGGGLVGLVLVLTGVVTRGVPPLWSDVDGAPRRESKSIGLTAAAAVAAVALVASVAIAVAVGRPWHAGAPPVFERVTVADTGLVLDLPDVIAGKATEEASGPARLFGYGGGLEAPVLVEIVTVTLPQALPPDQVAAAMESLRAESNRESPGGATLSMPARVAQLNGRPVVVVQYRRDSLLIHSWLSLLGDRTVVLRVYQLPGMPASWADVPERIAGSLARPDLR